MITARDLIERLSAIDPDTILAKDDRWNLGEVTQAGKNLRNSLLPENLRSIYNADENTLTAKGISLDDAIVDYVLKLNEQGYLNPGDILMMIQSQIERLTWLPFDTDRTICGVNGWFVLRYLGPARDFLQTEHYVEIVSIERRS